MTVNIAVVGDPALPDDRDALTRARALSREAAADLEWWPLTVPEVDEGRLLGFDAIWFMAWPETPGADEARRAAWAASHQGIPFVVSAAEPPGWFVGQARERTAYRIRAEQRATELAALEAAEREPRSYVHQMRGPRYRWWRPLVALAVATVVFIVCASFIFAVPAVTGLVGSEDDLANPVSPWGSLTLNLALAALIPATLLGVWAGFGRSPWRVFSVARRMRWGWLGWCFLVLLPLWAAYLAVTWFVFDQEVLDRPEHWVALLVITALTTPLQAAGEEVAFRGGLVQGVGAWFRSPVVAFVVTLVLSTALFAAAHGSADPWIVIELGCFAVAGCWLAWRTGGLEAAIALHVVNNLLITFTGILLGGLDESYVDTTSTGSPVSALMNVAATALVTAVLLWLARRRGIAPRGWRTPALG
ncbi:CPBP family intramembrane glutamic endopeptidase [Knoellia subterranea]|uniref:Abortive infection protein n=1 Tax=Knoellia subterranea KCTC 19937 TaxID=1385521 RepID=A0A0A0JQ15_9MICO|nr:CPBP family intramembrane glutamic endopeptidase [Knoellia subterranea]KGN39500.1 abortive infection protein [Knoellia subterranea KCTC 19937]